MSPTTPATAVGTAEPRAPVLRRRERPQVDEGPAGAPLLGADYLVVALLVVAAGALRLGGLGPSSLWLDDAWLALSSRAGGLDEVVMVGATAPGFAALLAGVLAVAGFSEIGAQALPFAFGVAAAPGLYLVARRMGLARPAAIAGAALMVSAPLHILYSGRVKPFTADALGAMVVLLAGWRVVERPQVGRRWAWLGAASVVATVVSAAAAATIAGAYLAGLPAAATARHRRLGPALAATGGFAVFALAWWAAVFRHASTPALRAYWADHYVDVGTGPVNAGGDLLRGLAGVTRGLAALPPALGWLVVVVAAAVVVARRPRLAVLLLAPLAVAVVLATLELAPLGGGRTDIHLYPALALLVAVAVQLAASRALRPSVHANTDAAPRPPARPLAGTGAVAALVGVLAIGAAPSPAYPAEDVRPLVAAVENLARPDDGIVVYSASRWAYALYAGRPVELRRDRRSANGFDVTIDDERVTVLEAHRDAPAGHAPAVDRLAADHDRLWLVTSHGGADVAVIEEMLRDRGYTAATTQHRPGAALALWSR
ncbi:MAG: hypothetical protein ACR2K0_01175 [Acidimicrobiales bacterium]